MKTRGLLLVTLLTLTVVLAPPACWARTTAYGYVIAYSPRDQMVYHTPIITQRTQGASSSDEEYFMDTRTILNLESGFQKHLEQHRGINSRNFTFSARVGFKSEAIARDRFNEESGNFRFRGFQIIEMADFNP